MTKGKSEEFIWPGWLIPILNDVRTKTAKDSTGHDYLHAKRVCRLSYSIASNMKADAEAAVAASLLHDYFRYEEKEDGILHYSQQAVDRLKDRFQDELEKGLDADRLKSVWHAILAHENYFSINTNKQKMPAVTQILQDADRIDAIGAIGIARAFAFSGAHGLPIYTEKDRKSDLFDPSKKPEGSTYTHFYSKLLKLYPTLNTEPGRKIAQKRHDFMRSFIEQFEREADLL